MCSHTLITKKKHAWIAKILRLEVLQVPATGILYLGYV